MALAIRISYRLTSKCVQMEPQQLRKTSKYYSICNKCDMHKTAWVPPPGRLKVKQRYMYVDRPTFLIKQYHML